MPESISSTATKEIEHTFEVFHSKDFLISNVPDSTMYDIKIQQYLRSQAKIERRVRWTIHCGSCTERSDLIAHFEHTRKYPQDAPRAKKGPQRRLEDNEQINRNEFHLLCQHEAAPGADLIVKDRLTFLSPNRLNGKRPEIEIDIFRWPVSDIILCEVEVDTPNAERFFPSWLELYRNVNGNDRYSNQQIAQGSLG